MHHEKLSHEKQANLRILALACCSLFFREEVGKATNPSRHKSNELCSFSDKEKGTLR